MDDRITRAIAEVAIFLEFAPHEIVDEDAAVEALEQLAGNLNALDEASRRDLSASFRVIAPSYEGETRRFVEELPEALGLEEPREEDG